MPPSATAPLAALTDEVRALGLAHGLDAVGVATGEPFVRAREVLEERKLAGLHGGMAFTYKNPARSTDPGASVRDARAIVVGARSYLHHDVDEPGSPSGRVARYAWGDQYAPLRRALWAVAHRLRADGLVAGRPAARGTASGPQQTRPAGRTSSTRAASALLPGTGPG